MKVMRIVSNISADNPEEGRSFYCDVLGLETVMDLGWITTLASGTTAPVQISIATEGGSGTQVPDLSIEVDDVDEAFRRTRAGGFEITYPLTSEPWGVRRFYARDPYKKIVNVMSHV